MRHLTQGGHNILLSSGPPDTLWKRQRELTAPINKDRFGENSLVAVLFRASYKICDTLSEEMKVKHGAPLDLFRYLFHFMVVSTPAYKPNFFIRLLQTMLASLERSLDTKNSLE
jgi:hypothetical protein